MVRTFSQNKGENLFSGFQTFHFLGFLQKYAVKSLEKCHFWVFWLFSYIKDPQMYRKRQYQKSTASHGPVTLIFSERLFYLDTNEESPILEQSERKVSFWDTLSYPPKIGLPTCKNFFPHCYPLHIVEGSN